MFRQTPMYKFGRSYHEGYVMFTAAKSHFATHAIHFDLVQQAKDSIPGAAGGKGNVSVKYTNDSAKRALRSFIEAVMAVTAFRRSRHDRTRLRISPGTSQFARTADRYCPGVMHSSILCGLMAL